ncbi:reverse transcriptase family protein [Sorangium sp. So ce145]|uniref:reverse transcriptase family protein n=1 Tax=Sorangium sp. So ce145 TaxID=3133285 RepID=UPI003F5EEBC8
MGFWDKLKSMLGLGGAEQGERAPGGVEAEQARPAQAGPAAATQPAARAGQPRVATGAKPRPADPYDGGGILGLSADELRRRALKINPRLTAWIGRVDTIPPQSDERTALIDRGLVLRGLLTEAQLAEIHRVGDLWLRHKDAAALAGTVAARSADEAIERLKREKLARKEEKRRQSAERKRQRAEAVARRRAEDILFLGTDVSAGLADRRSHVESLAQRGLPVLSTPADLAAALGVAVPRLRWLCFHGEAVERPHYVYFDVPKRSGGTRQLAAPHASLAAAQAWVLREILEKLPVEAPAHGFVKGRSTVTNARPHTRRDVVVNLDLSDFFPTITFPRVRGVFHRLGYSPAVATLLALLCTEAPRRPVEYDGQRYWVAVGDRALPQGACTSPALSNQIARKLDRRLAGMCARAGFTYTRYADDLTFSAPPGKRGDIAMLLARVRHIVEEEGFAINPDKGRIQRAGGRQVVTGVVVNDKPSAPREEVRRLRAILHAAKKTGLAAQNRSGVSDFEAHLRGRIAYVQMIDRERAAPLLAALDALTG